MLMLVLIVLIKRVVVVLIMQGNNRRLGRLSERVAGRGRLSRGRLSGAMLSGAVLGRSGPGARALCVRSLHVGIQVEARLQPLEGLETR